MNVRKIFKNGFMAICLLGTIMEHARAMEADLNETDLINETVLIIGCRPWDANLQEVPALNTAHFVDFRTDGAPEEENPKFHHLDFNNEGIGEAGNFTEFANENPKKFTTILIDWFTYHHIRRDTAWADLDTLLGPDGTLIVPIAQTNMFGASISKNKARVIKDTLTEIFRTVEIFPYKDMLPYTGSSLLKRLGVCTLFLCVEKDLSEVDDPLWEQQNSGEDHALHLQNDHIPALIKSEEGNYRLVFATRESFDTMYPVSLSDKKHIDFLHELFEQNDGKGKRASVYWGHPAMQAVLKDSAAEHLILSGYIPSTLESMQPHVVVAKR